MNGATDSIRDERGDAHRRRGFCARPASSDDFFGSVDEIPPGVPALVVELPCHPAKVYPADRTYILVLSDHDDQEP
jgi:hypothetical protein